MAWWLPAVLGAGIALALWAAWRALFPPPLPFPVALDRLSRAPALIEESTQSSVKRRVGDRLTPVLEDLGVDLDTLRVDARVMGLSLSEHLGSKVTNAAIGPLGVVAVALLLTAAGVAVPAVAVILAGVVMAGVGFVGSDIVLHQNAEERRADFLSALSSYLDLVSISIEGGMGWNGAVVEAARIGDGWAFELLRLAIDASNYDNRGVWDGFAQLGAELQIPALAELAASISLAGSEGARVRASIATKADSLRHAQLAEAEAAEAASTERMSVPTVMMLAGFLLLVGFPSLYAVATGV